MYIRQYFAHKKEIMQSVPRKTLLSVSFPLRRHEPNEQPALADSLGSPG